MTSDRQALVQRGLLLNSLALGNNAIGGVMSLGAGVIDGSPALIGFGVGSLIDMTARAVAQRRLRTDPDQIRPGTADARTRRLTGWLLLALAATLAFGSLTALLWPREPARSFVGVFILSLYAIAMPPLARAKRRIAAATSSDALAREAGRTSLWAYVSMIGLAGVGLNALLNWWWADPAAALAMVPMIAREGLEAVKARPDVR
jgi:hypothetical protein